MKKNTFTYVLALSIILFNGCTKEVQIEIPGYESQIVIDGRIETDQPPLVLISRSQEVYSPTDVSTFLNGFISGATVTVSNGTNTVELIEICSDSLPEGSEAILASILGIPEEQWTDDINLCAYTTLDPSIWGEVGKTYSLNVNIEGNTYAAETSILEPTSLDSLWWQPEPGQSEFGFSWARLSDPPGVYDAYRWEVRRVNTDSNGLPMDFLFEEVFNPVFDDRFFDGLTFNFAYENPFTDDPELPEGQRWHYKIGDSIIVKLSKMDRNVFEYMEKKYVQLGTNSNPFATPTNVPSNISGGALGVWAGLSPIFDTLICLP